jgi:hypothetical protein
MATAALLLAGGLVKHNLLPIPLAITLWLAWHDRAALRTWLAVSGVGLAACALAFAGAFGVDALVGVVAAPRDVRLAYVWVKLGLWLPPLLPYLAACLLLSVLDRREPTTRLLGLQAALAALFGAVSLAGAGVSYNALFDLVIAATIASAVAVARVAERAAARGFDARAARALGMLLLALPVLVSAPAEFARVRRSLATLPAQEALDAADIAFVAEQDGVVLCETPALCYWAGKTFELDLFNAHQRIARGALDARDLERRFEQREFAAVQLALRDPAQPMHWLEAMARRHYHEARRSPRQLFLVPRPPPSPEPRASRHEATSPASPSAEIQAPSARPGGR